MPKAPEEYETPQQAMDDGVCPFCWGEAIVNDQPCSMCHGTGDWPPPEDNA